MGTRIGIDFGTTHCRVAFWAYDRPVIIPGNSGNLETPSVVGFGKAEERLIGQPADRQSVTHAARTVARFKRLMGQTWENTHLERSHLPYVCMPDAFNQVRVQIENQMFCLEEMAALVFWYLKWVAEDYLKDSVITATIAVPACFTVAQHKAIRDAAAIAGYDTIHLISNPLAITLGWAVEQLELSSNHSCLVLDWGGGSFDAAIVQMQAANFTVQQAIGVPNLGGDDVDAVLVQWMRRSFLETNGIDLLTDNMAVQRLWQAAAQAKIELSTTASTVVMIPFITVDETGPAHFEQTLTRQMLEELSQPLLNTAIACITNLLKSANLTPNDLSKILIVGGSSQIPAFQAAMRHQFPNIDLDECLYPTRLVVLGAATWAEIRTGELSDWQTQDVSSAEPPPQTGLSPDAIEHFRQQMKVFAQDYEIRQKQISLKDEAEQLLYTCECTLRDLQPASEKSELQLRLQDQISSLRSLMTEVAPAIQEFEDTLKTLQETLFQIGKQTYRNQFSKRFYKNDSDWSDLDESNPDDDEPTALGVRRRFPRSPQDRQPSDLSADAERTIP